jgi:3-deoxy-manno-octulosonate cytidylyltransferase (CMP-KDO synthetase)
MKTVGVIPARWQSSRFPGKPLAHILGKSLIRRTYENALRSKSLDAVVVATDDQRIFDHVQEFGAKVFMTSPSSPTGTDRAWEVIEHHFKDAEVIVNIQGDEPCLDPAVIDTLVNKLCLTPAAMLTTPVAIITDPKAIASPNDVKCVFDCEGKALYFSRSPIPFTRSGSFPYYRHLGVYCFRRSFMQKYALLARTPLQQREDLEQLKILENGFPIHVCIVEDQATGVDTPEDLKAVEKLLCQKENICL